MIEREPVIATKSPGWPAAVAVLGLALALCGLGWSLYLQNRLTESEKNLAETRQQNTQLADRIEDTNERMKAQGEALGQSMGLTQKQIEDRSNELIAAQRTTAAATSKLAVEQAKTAEQVGAVQNDVSAVKTDVGGVKNDVATTQADLADTKTQMTRVMGDQNQMSGLIATNHDELEQLKRMGERNYYEFTLTKGGPAQNVGTIKLQLKKVDTKRSKFTLNVSSDDKTIEKKDKNLDEPIQFYSGKQPALFEVVVNNLSKNQVSGYLSAPKSAPAPIAVP
jgi:predicted  nucleic acid-binding Zn-ribbon protein